jgi:hypothetical protein
VLVDHSLLVWLFFVYRGSSLGVDFFSTYAGAALAAYQKQLITKRDLVDIVATAERELDTLRFLGPQGDTMKQARRREFANDAEQVLRQVDTTSA